MCWARLWGSDTKYLLSHPYPCSQSTICYCGLIYTPHSLFSGFWFITHNALCLSIFNAHIYFFHIFISALLSCRYRGDFVYWSGARWCDSYPQQWDHYAVWCRAGQWHLYCQRKHAHRLDGKPGKWHSDTKQQQTLYVNLLAASPNMSPPLLYLHQVRVFLWQRPTSQTHRQGREGTRLTVPTTQRGIRDTHSSVAPMSFRPASTRANWLRLWWSAQVRVCIYYSKSVNVQMLC